MESGKRTYGFIFMICHVMSIFVPVLAIHDKEVLNLYKNIYRGDGTYYWESEGGTCSLNVPSLPSVARHVDKLVALNAPQIYGSSACGICLMVNGSGNGLGLDPIQGSFIAYVKDKCPECHSGDVDFAETGDGRWDITIQAVQCPVTGPIEYTLEGSNDYYIKLQVRNDRMPTTTLKMLQSSRGSWATMVRTRDGHWQFPTDGTFVDKPIRRPFVLQLHAPNGEILYDVVNPPSMGFVGVIHGRGVQYALDPTLPAVQPRSVHAGK
ncbi:hypothetical protein ACF0H5_013922 [Mactra antiquata]